MTNAAGQRSGPPKRCTRALRREDFLELEQAPALQCDRSARFGAHFYFFMGKKRKRYNANATRGAGGRVARVGKRTLAETPRSPSTREHDNPDPLSTIRCGAEPLPDAAAAPGEVEGGAVKAAAH